MSVGVERTRSRNRPGVPLAKTAVPRLSHRHVSRARLLAALDEATADRVTLVSAPAGYGKTSLLAEWVGSRPGSAAWVSLDDDDTDDRRFWSALLTSLSSCAAVPVDNPLHGLAVPRRPSRDPEFLAAVVDAIAIVPDPVRLVLDDVHELTAPEPLRGLASLVRDLPPGLRIVLSGRVDPPLPLSRMRLAGQLHEIRADLLRFSVPETTEMLTAGHIPARADQVRLLVEQTEGWAAGLRLAALSLRDAEDPDQYLTDLVGNSRAISDYLVGEVLSGLPEDTRELLSSVSICDRLSASLAVALSSRPDAGEVLGSLERDTGLVLSLGRGRTWYRVHPLLRSHLLADLRRQRPDVAAQLHDRAADWFDNAGMPEKALAYARHSEDTDRLATLLQQHATVLIANGEHEPVRAGVAKLGTSLRGKPRLILIAALVAIERGEFAEADRHLRHVATNWPAEPDRDLNAFRLLVRSRRAIVAGAPPNSDDEIEPSRLEDLGLAPMAKLHRAIGLSGAGSRDEARNVAASALMLARQQQSGYLSALALALRGVLAGADGDYRQMAAFSEAADAEPANPGWRSTIGAAWSSTLRAYAALLRVEPAACLRLTSDDVSVTGMDAQHFDQLRGLRAALRGTALFDLDRRGEGMDVLRQAHRLALAQPDSAEITATVALLEYRAAALLSRDELVRIVLSWATKSLGSAGEVLLLRARQRAVLGRYQAASESLAPLLEGRSPPVLPWVSIEARVLQCQLALRLERRTQARRELEIALALATTMNVLRPLAAGPPAVVDLLIRRLGSFGDDEPTALRVLEARNTLGIGSQPVSLTERERDVLNLLPTQRSLDEIAGELTVTSNTVKTHVRAIYSKFGVSARRDAVDAARRLGVLYAAGSDFNPGSD